VRASWFGDGTTRAASFESALNVICFSA